MEYRKNMSQNSGESKYNLCCHKPVGLVGKREEEHQRSGSHSLKDVKGKDKQPYLPAKYSLGVVCPRIFAAVLPYIYAIKMLSQND